MKSHLIVAGFVLLSACTTNTDKTNNGKTGTADKNYTITQADMKRIDVGDGEVVYQAEGKNHGMRNMSFVITETQPGGGPPLHVHPEEEAHIVLSGRVKYFIDDSVFTVDAPYIVRIPPGAKHTFMNAGDTVLRLIGAFGQDNFGPYQPIAENPLFN